jgi:dipeptide/tripeptide permease
LAELVVDQTYEPDPEDAPTRKSVLKNVAGFIIVTEFCERFAYYGFAGSLVLFFQVLFFVFILFYFIFFSFERNK